MLLHNVFYTNQHMNSIASKEEADKEYLLESDALMWNECTNITIILIYIVLPRAG